MVRILVKIFLLSSEPVQNAYIYIYLFNRCKIANTLLVCLSDGRAREESVVRRERLGSRAPLVLLVEKDPLEMTDPKETLYVLNMT